MPSIIVPVSKKFREETVRHLAWVNWSELSREESRMKLIFEVFIKTGKLSDEDRKFCEENDWHPVDWLPFKEGYLKELESARKEKPIKLKSASGIFK